MTIQGTELQIKEYRGKRVVTFKDVDAVHQRPEGTAFNDRKLDAYMSDNNITADKLSEMSGICYSLVNRYRKGETSPGSENRTKITRSLGLPDGYFDKRVRNRRN